MDSDDSCLSFFFSQQLAETIVFARKKREKKTLDRYVEKEKPSIAVVLKRWRHTRPANKTLEKTYYYFEFLGTQ